MATNDTSAVELSDATTRAICRLLDGSCPVPPSEQPRFVIAAYLAVFVPWGFLSLFDMITERWKTIRAIASQAAVQILIAIPTTAYTVYYIELQRSARDYKEMCAAIVAVCLSTFHFCRTLWALWQLFHVWTWVKSSLRHLHQHGYSLEDIDRDFYHDENGFWHRMFFTPVTALWRKLPTMCRCGKSPSSVHMFEQHLHLDENASDDAHERPSIKTMSRKLLACFRYSADRLDERMVWRLAGKMYINSSVLDNEFFDCDVPFKLDVSLLLRPRKWWTSRRRVLRPRYFSDACVRYMVTFLAQYGRRWLIDSQKALQVLKNKKKKKGLLMSYFLDHARIMTSTCLSDESREGFGDPQQANWSNTWSRVIMFREMQRSYALDQGVRMPFGYRSQRSGQNQNSPFKLAFARYESKIKRLIDNLPPGLFEIRREEVDVIESISFLDLENFLLFLQCEPVVPVSTGEPKTCVTNPRGDVAQRTNTSANDRESEKQTPCTGSNSCSHSREGGLCDHPAKSEDMHVEMSVETARDCGRSVPESSIDEIERLSDTGNESKSSGEDVLEGGTPPNGATICADSELDICRILDKKLGLGHLPEIESEQLHRDAESPLRGIREWSQNCVVEYTVHLENLFAVGNEYDTVRHQDPERREEHERMHWDAYLEELRIHSSLSSFLQAKDVRPVCLSQLYYWNLWKLPDRLPPALGDTGLEDYGSDTKGIRFIGYVMERVRNCLAKWTVGVDASDLNKSCWIAKIPEEPVVIRATSDISMLCEGFEKRKEVQTIYVDEWESGDRWCRWTSKERVVWECQKCLIELLDGNERAYGPGDAELMLLFLLGFPVLRVRSFKDAVVLKPVAPAAPSLFVALSLRAKNVDVVDIEMKILQERIPLLDVMEGPVFPHINFAASGETGPDAYLHPLEFCWVDWIHMFDGCMKVLSLEFDENDFCKESFSRYGGSDDDSNEYEESDYTVKGLANSNGRNFVGQDSYQCLRRTPPKDISGIAEVNPQNNAVVNSSETGTNSDGENDWATPEHENESDTESRVDRRLICLNEHGNNNGDIYENERDPVEDDEEIGFDGSGQASNDARFYLDTVKDNGMRDYNDTDYNLTEITFNESLGVQGCKCDYRLERRARQQIMPGGRKYYWIWDGWKPQPAFLEYPILYEMNDTDSTKKTCRAEEKEVKGRSLSLEGFREQDKATSSGREPESHSEGDDNV